MTTLPQAAPASASSGARRGRRRPGTAVSVIALVPFLAFLLVFAVYPFAQVVRLAFSTTSVTNGEFVSVFAGLANFAWAATDPDTWHSVLLTFLFIVLTVGLTLVLGVLLGIVVDRAVIMVGLARNILIWPAVITPVVVSVIWLLLLSPTVGGINKFAENLGLPTQEWLNTGIGAFACVVVVDVWHWTPIVFLFVYTALRGMSPEIFEAARVDGARELTIVRRVTLPLLVPVIVLVAILRLVMSVKAFDEMYLLTKGGPDGATNLISLQIRSLFFDKLDLGGAAAVSLLVVVVTIVVVGIVFLARRLVRRTA